MSTEPPTEQLGMEGEGCSACGAPLATDQRYCLNCGQARTGPRLDFTKHLTPAMGGGPPMAAAGAAGAAGAAPAPGAGQSQMSMQQINPITAIFAIALLGVMLLLGVLIGKDDDGTATVAAAPATTTAPTAAAPVETAATPTKDKGADKGAGAAPGQGNIETGGSGDTSGVAAADTTADPSETVKGPDVVATQGEQEELDPDGPVGGGSPSTCIGC
jgi:hypothetical protein